MVYILSKDSNRLKTFLNEEGFAVNYFTNTLDLELGIAIDGFPDTLITDDENIKTIEKYKYDIDLILGMTDNYSDSDLREKMLLAGCVSVEKKTSFSNILTSIIYGLKKEFLLWH